MKRLRLVAVRVQPILMVDDGTNLTPWQNGASEIAAADFDAFPEKLRADIVEAEQQLNADEA